MTTNQMSLKIFTVLVFIGLASATTSSFSFWSQDVASNIVAMNAGMHNPYRDFNQYLNNLFFSWFKLDFIPPYVLTKFGPELGYYVESYLRDLFFASMVYWVTAGVWHVVIYHIYAKEVFTDKGRPFPSVATMTEQMQLAQASLFVYAGLPILSEFLIESKVTKTYYYIDQVGGWGFYALYFVLYLALVEVGVYWVHRRLHENKFLYKYVHGLHHKYNQQVTMTPWCSIAFNPLDGILQASPYVVALFIVPMHYYTHLILLFCSGVWATNIHDAIYGNWEPIMGAKYHLMHHTHYHYNFGQYFTFCDYIFGSLKVPPKSKFD